MSWGGVGREGLLQDKPGKAMAGSYGSEWSSEGPVAATTKPLRTPAPKRGTVTAPLFVTVPDRPKFRARDLVILSLRRAAQGSL